MNVVMPNVANNPFMLSVVVLNVVMLNVSNNPFMLSVVMLNIVMLTVQAPSKGALRKVGQSKNT